MSDQANNITSALINTQVPEFVRNEHQTFVQFLEYYYKFLEQDGKQTYVAKNLLNFLDIDGINRDVKGDLILGDDHTSREEGDYHSFLQKMYDNFINYIPDTVLADRVLILKHAKDFYRSRGSEKSVRFLVRALLNKEVSFYYPKQDVLRASDGKWYIEKSLKVKDVAVNNVSNSVAVSQFANHLIKGTSSGATATVESVDIYFDKGQIVYELKLSGLYKEFENSEEIFTFYTEEGNDRYLSANLFSGVITAVTIITGGSGYTEGSTIPITSNGTGASIVISKVSKGIIQGIGVSFGGAGFRANDSVVISAPGGSGASANVSNVNYNGFYHPNSYNVMWTTINLEANTAINNTKYSNLVSSITDPANAWVTNSMSFFAYSNCGPAVSCFVINTGNNYVAPISLSISANSLISKLGILGRMSIVNGGTGYAANDKIDFINPIGSYGTGAFANVVSVNASGSITEVRFIAQPGQIIGGSGYDWLNLPKANVISGTGSGANIAVVASIGHNESLVASNSSIGTIQEISIVDGGTGYIDNPVLRLDQLGDGTANATLSIVTGTYSYPGRYVNDDGHISSYNFLQDRDYYQNYSYVVRVDDTINKYRKPIKDLIHPAGMKLFGEYLNVDDQGAETNTNVNISYANTESNAKFLSTYYQVQGYASGVFAPNVAIANAKAEILISTYSVSSANQSGTYDADGNVISIYSAAHGFSKNNYVYIQFTTNGWANLANSSYYISYANTDYLTLVNPLIESSNTGNVRLYDPKVTITVPYSRPSINDNVYLRFVTKDPLLANGNYTVRGVSSTTSFWVLHPSANSANDTANSVNVMTKKLVITANSHGFSAGNLAYLKFTSGDTANATNGYYIVTSVGNGNTFNVVTQNIVMATSNVSVYQKRADIIVTNHAASNGNTIYVTFTSDDQGNTVNGIYSLTKVGANRISINTSKSATSNANVRIWYSTNNYTNVQFTRTSHGFVANNNVRVEFFSSAIDLANGVYMIKKANSNTYNIFYNANTYYYSADYLATENLLTNANNIAGSPWFGSTTTATANSAISPVGNTTAATLTATGSDSYQGQTINGLVLNRAYRFSVWLKAPTSSNVSIGLLARANTVAPYVSDFTTTLNVTNTWKKFSIDFIANTTTAQVFIGAYGTFTTGESVYAWGAQANTSKNIIYYSGLGVTTNSKMEGDASVGLYK